MRTGAPSRQRTVAAPEPRVTETRPVKVAAVHVTGDLRRSRDRALRALYASVGALRAADLSAGLDFDIGPLRVRLPDAQRGPIESWHATFAVAIPEHVGTLPQLDRDLQVDVEIWVYGTAAELMHEGPDETKPASVQRLQEFIAEKGYRPAGWREEILLGTGPHGLRTLIRYPVA